MKNRGSTLILTNLVGIHPKDIQTKFEANPCSGLREVENLKKNHADYDNDDDDNNDGHRVIRSLSVTKNGTNCLSAWHAIRYRRILKVQPDCLKGRVVCGSVYRDI